MRGVLGGNTPIRTRESPLRCARRARADLERGLRAWAALAAPEPRPGLGDKDPKSHPTVPAPVTDIGPSNLEAIPGRGSPLGWDRSSQAKAVTEDLLELVLASQHDSQECPAPAVLGLFELPQLQFLFPSILALVFISQEAYLPCRWDGPCLQPGGRSRSCWSNSVMEQCAGVRQGSRN